MGNMVWTKKNELAKHARIKIDIPNTLDDIWEIDIKKQSAFIPKKISNQLSRQIEEAIKTSEGRERYRGRNENINDNIEYIWSRIKDRDRIRYEINRDSVIFDQIKQKVDDNIWNEINSVLKEIENTLPYQQIYHWLVLPKNMPPSQMFP